MQAGSELSWNMSGPLFSKQEESSSYTSVNIVTAGIRGLHCASPRKLPMLSDGTPPLSCCWEECAVSAASLRMLSYRQSNETTLAEPVEFFPCLLLILIIRYDLRNNIQTCIFYNKKRLYEEVYYA